MKTILITLEAGSLLPRQLEKLKALSEGYHLLISTQTDVIRKAAEEEDVEIALGHAVVDFIPRMHALRWVQLSGAGMDWLKDHPEIIKRQIILTNASGVHTVPMAEHSLSMMLAFARGLPRALRAQQKHCWDRPEHESLFELEGKTLLLLGIGGVNRGLIRVASALGMRVLGVRRRLADDASSEDAASGAATSSGIQRVFGADQLPEALPQADFVVVGVPLTEETHHLIDEHALKLMKPGAYLINISRGNTVDEEALVEALRQGWIAGAGLDVFEIEPLPADSPLWDFDNVIITQHYAGLTPRYDQRLMDIFLENLERYRRGETLINVYDRSIGY